MRSKLFLHIGTHKTGSTAIQQVLSTADQELLREKLVYITIPFTLASALMETEVVDYDVVNRVKELILSKANKYPDDYKIVISFEGFAGSILKGYRNSAFIAESLHQITSEFDVTIVAYLRRQDEFLESAYTQMIHQGESWDMQTFIGKFDQDSFDWLELLDNYAKFFGENNIMVVPYSKSQLVGNCSLIESFAEIIDSKVLKDYKSNIAPNTGYSRDALEIARLCNPSLDQQSRKVLRTLLQQTNTKQPFESYNYLTRVERSRVVSRYYKSNAQVADKYLGNKSGELFPDITGGDIPEGDYQGLTPASLGVVLVNVILGLQNQQTVQREHSKLVRLLAKAEGKLARLLKKSLMLKNWINRFYFGN